MSSECEFATQRLYRTAAIQRERESNTHKTFTPAAKIFLNITSGKVYLRVNSEEILCEFQP